MVVYTPLAQQAVGGATAMTNLINLGISETNTTYVNSDVHHLSRRRLALGETPERQSRDDQGGGRDHTLQGPPPGVGGPRRRRIESALDRRVERDARFADSLKTAARVLLDATAQQPRQVGRRRPRQRLKIRIAREHRG